MKKYFPKHHATIKTDHLFVTFERLYEDVRDQMCDAVRPDWSPVDEFYISIKEVRGSERELAFHGDRIFANNIYRLAKKFDDFGVVVNGARVLLEQA